MIDLHAHLFRNPSDLLRPSAPLASRVLARAGHHAIRRLEQVDRALGWRSSSVVARARHLAPVQLGRDVLDVGMSLASVPNLLFGGSLEQLRSSMSRAGVRRAAVIASPQFGPNEWLLEQVKGQADLVPVAHVPRGPVTGWQRQFEALAQRGARGFKIHPPADGLGADAPAYAALFEVARQHRRFVILHTGCFYLPGSSEGGRADPTRFRHLFGGFPEVPVCLAHMNRDRPEIAWQLLEQFPQLVVDTSWQPPQVIRRALDRFGPRRVLLGSDWPVLNLDVQSEAAAHVRRVARAAELEQMARAAEQFLAGERPA